MERLPEHLKQRFYRTITGEISIEEFEHWLYADKELENYMNFDDHLDLISLNFRKSGAKYELWNLLKKHIDLGEFETHKILRLLYEAKEKGEELPLILMEFYDLYYKGYSFLKDLGLGIGLAIECPPLNNFSADSWDELPGKQQQKLLEILSPELEIGVERVIDWLESKKIILTGEQDES